MFALECLHLAGYHYENSEPVRRACAFLVSKQNAEDGGWGEGFESCVRGEWTPTESGRSEVVQTSWALLGLLHAQYPDEDGSLRRGAEFVLRGQEEDGSWRETPEGRCVGVFNRNCGIVYPNYR